jgi:hypothetical protein
MCKRLLEFSSNICRRICQGHLGTDFLLCEDKNHQSTCMRKAMKRTNSPSMEKPRGVFVLCMAVLLSIFSLSSLWYEHLIPPFENPDEVQHLAYATSWAALLTEGLEAARNTPNVGQERYQPPVYYLSCIPVILSYSLVGKFSAPERNPAFDYSPRPPGEGLQRLYAPLDQFSTKEMEITARACRSVRLLSLLWGLSACIWGAAWVWKLSQGNLALTVVATSLFALNPRWVETSVSVSNDAAAACMANMVIWIIIDTLQSPDSLSKKRISILGLACSVASLTKFSGLGLLPLSLIAVSIKNNQNNHLCFAREAAISCSELYRSLFDRQVII